MQRNFPYDIRDLDQETQQQLFNDFPEKFVRVSEKNYFLPSKYKQFARKYHDFKTRADDVFVAGFPRSGTTLLQELVWLLCNDVDIDKGKQLERNQRVYNFEVDIVVQDDTKNSLEEPKNFLQFQHFDEINERRFFKTHLPLSLLPQDLLESGSKILYIARNPKDVMVSLYHYLQRITYRKCIESDFETFAHYFTENKLRFTPYFETVHEFWQRRNSPNLHFIFYEDLLKDLRGGIVKIAKFLEKSPSEEQTDLLENVMQFENFKKYFDAGPGILVQKNDGNDGHVRKGQFGKSHEYFKDDFKRNIDAWILDNVRRTGIDFAYLY